MRNLEDQLQKEKSDEKDFKEKKRLAALTEPLLLWYETYARSLPWRNSGNPYWIWISEIMLQQTRVEAVKPYFLRFIAEIPDVPSLAEVEDERLLKLWEGLGYYSRARNLKKAAAKILEEFNGRLPESYESLLTLTGIGSYTAGAIASMAYGIPVPAVDGNVMRVISRIIGSREDILKQSVKKQIEKMILDVMPKENAGTYNQSLIELGALVCIPNGKPLCQCCPVFSFCIAGKKGLIHEIPVKTPKKPRKIQKKTILLLKLGNQFAIQKREDKGLLASLYELPNLDGEKSKEEIAGYLGIDQVQMKGLPEGKHVFSHVEWHMKGYCIELEKTNENISSYIWATADELKSRYPLPNAFSIFTNIINKDSERG